MSFIEMSVLWVFSALSLLFKSKHFLLSHMLPWSYRFRTETDYSTSSPQAGEANVYLPQDCWICRGLPPPPLFSTFPSFSASEFEFRCRPFIVWVSSPTPQDLEILSGREPIAQYSVEDPKPWVLGGGSVGKRANQSWAWLHVPVSWNSELQV